MRFNKLDLNLLVALDHLLNFRSVSAAAGADEHNAAGDEQRAAEASRLFP